MQQGKNICWNDDIVNDVTMLEEVAFISFLSFYILYGLIIILWLTDESQEIRQTFSLYYTTTYSGKPFNKACSFYRIIF